MSKPITLEVLAQRKIHVLEILARNPTITLNHIRTAYGYSEVWLKTLQAEGVKFGKPVRKHLTLRKTTCSQI